MKNQKWILFLAALALIAGTAALLARLKAHPRLGAPGIKAAAVPGSLALKIDLPERVLDFTSTNLPEPESVLGYLPSDTTYAERRYQSADGSPPIEATVVLMGADRTSIHNANYCLRGQGFNPDEKKIVNIAIGGATPYSLPVSEWKFSGVFPQPGGGNIQVNGVYVFWFVADGEETPDHFEMMKRLALHAARTGELQRWAYVSYQTQCAPGQQDAAFARMGKLIAASVPEYEPPPAAGAAAVAPR